MWQGVLEQVLPLIVSDWAEVGDVRAFTPLPPSVSKDWCPGKGSDLLRQLFAVRQTLKLCLRSKSFEGDLMTHLPQCAIQLGLGSNPDF